MSEAVAREAVASPGDRIGAPREPLLRSSCRGSLIYSSWCSPADRRFPVFELTWLLVIGIVGGAIALIDGIMRMRARGGSTIVGILEIVVAALFVLTLFVPAIPWSWLVLGIALLVVLIVAIVTRGGTGVTLPIIGIVLVALFLVLMNRWLVIPGIN
jgi:hypothetical protein